MPRHFASLSEILRRDLAVPLRAYPNPYIASLSLSGGFAVSRRVPYLARAGRQRRREGPCVWSRGYCGSPAARR